MLPASICAVDTEYSEKDVTVAQLLSIVISLDGETSHHVPPQFVKELITLQQAKAIIMQNQVVDLHMLNRYGVDLYKAPVFDTMLMSHLVDENVPHNHGLGDLVLQHFDDNYKKEFWNKNETYQAATEEEALEYEGKDAIYTYRLGLMFLDKLRGKDALIDHVNRLSRSLFETEIRGVRVNTELIVRTKETMGAEIQGYLPKLREQFDEYCHIWELNKWALAIDKLKTPAGKDRVRKTQFSFSSDKQVSWLVYEGLGCPVNKRTKPSKSSKKGNPATDYDTLKELSATYPPLELLVNYKGAKTLYSTFVEGMLERTKENRIYPRFNVNGTHTGRISHSNPNLANIPREGPIRSFFIPEEGNSIIGADFSQLEVIIEANLTKDKNLLRIVQEGVSKHDITAKELGIDRESAKTLNFAMQYHCTPFKVATLLKISTQEGQQIFDRYWQIYEGVKALKSTTDAMVVEGKPLVNMYGRERHLGVLENSTNFMLAKLQRQAYNYIIQGTGADITNRAFYLFSERLKSNGHGYTWWSVHDEIIAEVKDQYVEEEKSALVRIMEGISEELKLEHPLKAKAYGALKAWAKT